MSSELVRQYVRMLIAPNTRLGSIMAAKIENGNIELLFSHDPRFDNTLPDFWVSPSEVEVCERPSDAQVAKINMLSKYGSR